MRIVIGAFDKFLEHDNNSSKELLKKIKLNENEITKIILPVGYFKKEFIKPIKKYNPDIYLVIGMWEGDYCKVEICANNKMITLKNIYFRTIIGMYSTILKWFGKNLTINKPISNEKLTIIEIEKGPRTIQLKTPIPKIKYNTKTIQKSTNPGNYVCNYLIWTVEQYIQQQNKNTKFYFIHIPNRLTRLQEKNVLEYINKLQNDN